jgi:hypothetical protein
MRQKWKLFGGACVTLGVRRWQAVRLAARIG